MEELTKAQQRRVDGICEQVEEYLRLRFVHAQRVNPKIIHFVDDLAAQLMVNLRGILTKGMAWGPEKLMVADVLCGDDLDKRYDILGTTGQYSMMHEVVTSLDEPDRSADSIHIVDMRTFYLSIDATLGGLIELVQTWIWWDLPDAVNVCCFHAQRRRVEKLLQMEITDQMREYYHGLIHGVSTADITRDMVLGHEYRRLNRLVTEFELHRRDDQPHQEILKREVVEGRGLDDVMLDASSEIQALRRLESTEEFDDSTKEYYAERLGTDPTQISHEIVLEWQRSHVQRLKEGLIRAYEAGQVLGPPINFKSTQLKQMRAEHVALSDHLSPAAREFAEAGTEADTAETTNQ